MGGLAKGAWLCYPYRLEVDRLYGGAHVQSTKPAVIFFALAALATLLSLSSIILPGWVRVADARTGEAVKTPSYEVLEVQEAPGVRELDVATPARSELEMYLVARELSEQNTPEDGTLLVEFTKTPKDPKSTGFALVFDSHRAVLEAGQGETSERYEAGYDRADARGIMKKEGGMRVVSYAEFARENPGLWERAKGFLR